MAGSLKPDNVKSEGTWSVNGYSNIYGSQTPQSLVDSIRGVEGSDNAFYFYNPSYYIDITLNQRTSIWAIGTSNYPTDWYSIQCQQWNGSVWVDYATYTPTSNGSTWQLLFSNLPKGRYKFFQKNLGEYTAHGEWYLENCNVDKYLIKQGYDIYAVKSSNFNKINSGTPTVDQFTTYGSDDISSLNIAQTKNTCITIDKGILGTGKYFESSLGLDFKKINNIS